MCSRGSVAKEQAGDDEAELRGLPTCLLGRPKCLNAAIIPRCYTAAAPREVHLVDFLNVLYFESAPTRGCRFRELDPSTRGLTSRRSL